MSAAHDGSDGINSAPLDQLRHDLKTPLTTIHARAQLLERAIRRSPSLPEDERALLSWGEEKLGARQAARRDRQFADADRLRGELEERGFVVKDVPGGVVLERFS